MGTSKKDGYTAFTRRVKKLVLRRDNDTCKYPGCAEQSQPGAKLDIHHIDGDKENYAAENLISLCHSHHSHIEKTGTAASLAPYFTTLASATPSKRAEGGKTVLRDEKGRIQTGSAALNPVGRPREGESWAGILKWAGDLTGEQAASVSPEPLAHEFRKLGQLTLKQAASLRAYSALLFDPTAGLLNAVMDRAEGKLVTPVASMTWQEWCEKEGLDAGSIFNAIVAAAAGQDAGASSGPVADSGGADGEADGGP